MSILFLMLRSYWSIFWWNFFFKLWDLLSHPTIFHTKVCYLILSFNKVLGIKISIWSNSFIKILLLFQFCLCFDVFLLKFGDEIILKFNLFQTIIILCIRLCSLRSILILVIFKLSDCTLVLHYFCLIDLYFVLNFFQFVI